MATDAMAPVEFTAYQAGSGMWHLQVPERLRGHDLRPHLRQILAELDAVAGEKPARIAIELVDRIRL